MNNIWYKRIGFFNNPFSIKPAAYHDSLSGFGSTIDDISYAILTKKMVFIEGDYGQGKTTILKKIINDFGGKKQVAYFSCNRLDGRLDVQRLLKKRYGFLGNLFGLEAKDVILLLDEAQYLGNDDYKRLGEHHKTGQFKSIVFVSPKINGDANGLLSKALVVDLKNINQTEAVKIIRQRVGHLHLLSDEIINKTFERSNNNVRELLKNCERLCKYAVDNEMTKVTEELLDDALEKEEKTQAKKAAKKPLKKLAVKKKQETKKEREETALEEPETIAVEDEIKEELSLEDEDELDKQIKEMANMPDDIDEAEEEPKRRKNEQARKLEPEEALLAEEDYY